MHEHSMADHVLEVVDRRRREASASRVISITLQVSELSAITAESLQMMLDHAAEEQGVPSFSVILVCDGLLGYCPTCGIVPVSDDLACGKCGKGGLRPAADDALLLLECEFE